ncbi:acyl-CoA reductase [Hymenobacter qilianensis]|uniref:Acyl-CoA reductase n=1 Tax=Hymenobacter qilianensis TaxID=1385715 RepID=A0ACB5PQR0_9BACT|nr:acyl-CoA reductase [Hymenobacter qilianensis]GGF63033.1 acyl-CoA reductase [Hymenobacter qilianensis]
MNHTERLASFIALGQRLRHLTEDEKADLFSRARNNNSWFDAPNVASALDGIARLLEEDSFRTWANRYPAEPPTPRAVGVVMAGNIPLVGFHDLLCVVLSGHNLLAKPSSDDKFLMHWIVDELTRIEPRMAERITFVERLNAADAFIATGSDNTGRYFEYYFRHKPNLIRRNRTSLGILTGQETPEELAALGADIFQYYGLGCRNVSKLLVPKDYRFDKLLDNLQPWERVLEQNRYQNNYDYNKSILLVNRVPHLDNGFVLLTESAQLVSPISVVHYGTYRDEADLQQQLAQVAEQTQCLVSAGGLFPGSFAFGQAQCPSVSDYADGVDTMAFLTALT